MALETAWARALESAPVMASAKAIGLVFELAVKKGSESVAKWAKVRTLS